LLGAALAAAGTVGVSLRTSDAAAGPQATGPGGSSLPFKLYGPLLADDSADGTTAPGPAAPSNATPTATPAILPGVTPFPTQRSTYGSISITDRSSRVARGGIAHITINTSANSECTVKFVSPAGNVAKGDGLDPQMTDSSGNATWTWYVAANSVQGVWTLSIACTDAGVNTTVIVS
jgi:hypothetical protein